MPKRSAAPKPKTPKRTLVTFLARNLTARPLQFALAGGDTLIQSGASFEFSLSVDTQANDVFSLDIATPVSADGATLAPGGAGQLYTADGVWTFGKDLGGGIAAVRLNGFQPNAYVWSGSAMQVDRGGSLHLQAGEEWWVWTPRRFTRCAAP